MANFVKYAALAAASGMLLAATHVVKATNGDAIPKHVLTWAYDGGLGAQTDGSKAATTNDASKRHVQTWLSFAEAGIQINGHPQKAYYDCNQGAPCKNVIYYDPGKLYSTCWPDRDFISQNTDESYYLHDGPEAAESNRSSRLQMACAHQLATVSYPNGNNPAVGQWYAKHFLWLIPKNTNTVMFQDDSSAECSDHFQLHDLAAAPYEVRGGAGCDANIAQANRTIANQIHWPDGTPVPAIANALGVLQSQTANTAALPLIAPGSQIIGAVEENSVIHATTFRPRAVFGLINTASLVYAVNPEARTVFLNSSNAPPGSTDTCVDSTNNTEDSCGALQLRRNALASFWLAYREGHTVLWDNFTYTGNPCCGGRTTLAVYPEESLYLRSPVQALNRFDLSASSTDGSGCGSNAGSGGIQSFVVACGTLNDGTTPAGVYVREFRECYNFGQLIGSGHCAVVMNTTNRAVAIRSSWLRQTYTSVMSLGTGPINGGDVLTAGCGDHKCPTTAMDPFGSALATGTTQAPAFDSIFLFHN